MARRRGARRRVQRFQIEWFGDEFVEVLRVHGPEALWEAAKVVVAEASRRAPRKSSAQPHELVDVHAAAGEGAAHRR